MIDALVVLSRVLIAVAALLVLVRAWRGPSLFDRVLALDTLALVLVGYLLLEATARASRLYIDAALALALFSFAGAVFLGFFLGRGEFGDG